MNPLHLSAYTSLALQVVAGIIQAWGLTFKVPPADEVVREILMSELAVQVVEFLFYCYMVFRIFNNHSTASITTQRYIDWIITTPIMLINFALLFIYLDNKHEKLSYLELLRREAPTLTKILIANALMLLFGFLGETGIMNVGLSTAIGFIPFAYMFKLLYSEYVGQNTVSQGIFYGAFLIWALYGVSAVLPFAAKNTNYNILDLFAKNVFGVFLSFYIVGLSRRPPTEES